MATENSTPPANAKAIAHAKASANPPAIEPSTELALETWPEKVAAMAKDIVKATMTAKAPSSTREIVCAKSPSPPNRVHAWRTSASKFLKATAIT